MFLFSFFAEDDSEQEIGYPKAFLIRLMVLMFVKLDINQSKIICRNRIITDFSDWILLIRIEMWRSQCRVLWQSIEPN